MDQDQNADQEPNPNRNLFTEFDAEDPIAYREPDPAIESESDNSNQDDSNLENPIMSDPVSDPVHSFLGASVDLLPADRSTEDISLASKQFLKDGRDKLKKSDMKSWYKMRENCQKGINQKFTVIRSVSVDSNLESLKGTHHVRTLLLDLKHSIEENDMHDVFVIPNSFDENGKPTSTDSTNILEGIGSLKISTVETAMKMYIRRSPKQYHIENAKWSGDKILNSCDEELQIKLKESVESTDEDLKSGQIYLFWLNKMIISTSEKVFRTLTDKLNTLRLKQIEGEDVQKAGGYILFCAND